MSSDCCGRGWSGTNSSHSLDSEVNHCFTCKWSWRVRNMSLSFVIFHSLFTSTGVSGFGDRMLLFFCMKYQKLRGPNRSKYCLRRHDLIYRTQNNFKEIIIGLICFEVFCLLFCKESLRQNVTS